MDTDQISWFQKRYHGDGESGTATIERLQSWQAVRVKAWPMGCLIAWKLSTHALHTVETCSATREGAEDV